ncbi:MAG: autotransporter domain-containing protein [Sphingobium sp.]
MDRLSLTTCLTPVALILSAAPLAAQTSVGGARTAGLSTSSAGDVTVASGGSITLASGTAIAVDSNNSATVASGGTLSLGSANGASGIVQTAGTTGTISNAGTISILENFSADYGSSTGIVSGPIASASGRYGIHVLSGATTGGSISNSGVIQVEGLNSGGIVVDSPYSGSITNTGTISVLGDYSKGISTQSVTGDVTVQGTVAVVGEGAQAVVINGDVGGTFTIQGALSQSRTYTNDDGTTVSLSRSDLKSGKATVEVAGNVAGGIIVASTTSATGSIIAYGNSPALLIGGTSDITIGTVTGNDGTYSLAVDGTVSSSAYYSSTDAFGIVIGGQGGAVSLPGGIGVTGTVSATTLDSGATAILINSGSTVPYLYNSGTISTSITQPGMGAAYAIRDLSGTLTQIDNTGYIKVTGSSEDTINAIDLSANTTGVTINQYLNSTDAAAQATEQAASGYNPATATVYASITGNIVTGSGDDLLDIQTGGVYGDSYLNGGDDVVKLSGDADYVGDIHFGTGTATMAMSGSATFTGDLDVADQIASLTIADSAKYSGTVTGGSQLSVDVTGGTFGASKATTVAFDSLTVGSAGTLNVYVDSGAASLFQLNSATFASGSKISATLASLDGVEGRYTILTADTLSGTASFDSTTAVLPVLFKGDITVNTNSIDLQITRKTAAELGLSRTQGQAYEAIIAAGINTTKLGDSLLQAADLGTLKSQFQQLLPAHSGGVFDIVTRGSRLASRHITDADSLFGISDVGGWLEPFYFKGSRDEDGAVGFRTTGWGVSTGLERNTGVGYVGVSLAYIDGSVKTGDYQKVKAQDWELGVFWRKAAGPFYSYARLGAGLLTAAATRTFSGTADDTDFTYTAYGNWKGLALTGSAGASYTFALKGNLTLKPMVVVDYYRLHERGYSETGSAAIDLTVEGRTSDSLTAAPTLTVGWSMGQVTPDYRPLTFEIEGGPRAQLAGQLGTTTAAFADGAQFSLTPDALKGGWMAEARILQGSFDHSWKFGAGAEKTVGGIDYSARASLNVAF